MAFIWKLDTYFARAPQFINILWMGVDSTLWEEGGLKDHYFKSLVGVEGSSLCSAHINRKFCNRNLHLVIRPRKTHKSAVLFETKFEIG